MGVIVGLPFSGLAMEVIREFLVRWKQEVYEMMQFKREDVYKVSWYCNESSHLLCFECSEHRTMLV